MSKRRISLPSARRGPRIQAPQPLPQDTEHLPPAFSLRHLAKAYCISKCTLREKADFAETLRKLGQMPWAQLKQAPRRGLGYERIARHRITAGIPPAITDDVDRFYAFRFSGRAPMVGYRDGQVFHIIWLDRTFKLYDHG